MAHDFDLNTRTWYFIANGVVAMACLAEVSLVPGATHVAVWPLQAAVVRNLQCWPCLVI